MIASPIKSLVRAPIGSMFSKGGNSLRIGLQAYWRMIEDEWDGSTGEVLDYSGLSGAVLENLLIYSEAIVANWTPFGTITGSADSQAIGPDGLNNLSKLVDASATQYANYSESVSVIDNEAYMHTAYFKKTTSAPTFPATGIYYRGGGTPRPSFYTLNTDTGAVALRSGNVAADSVVVVDAGDFWRIEVTATNNATGNDLVLGSLYASVNADGSSTWVEATMGEVYCGYSQITKTSSSRPYIKTAGAAVLDAGAHGRAWNGADTIPGGKISRAGDFTPANSEYVEVYDTQRTRMIAGGTIAGWIAPDSTGEGAEGRVIDKGDGGVNGYALYVTGTNQIALKVGNVLSITGNNVYTDSVFTEVRAEFTADGRRLWVNEVEVALTNSSDSTLPADVAGSVYFSRYATSAARFFDGALCELPMWNRKLSVSEGLSFYNFGNGRII